MPGPEAPTDRVETVNKEAATKLTNPWLCNAVKTNNPYHPSNKAKRRSLRSQRGLAMISR